MKKISLAIAAAIVLGGIATQLHAVEKIVIKNMYGSPLVTAEKAPKTTVIIEEQVVDNQQRATLGSMDRIANSIRNGGDFYFRGTGMMSRFTSIQRYIKQIMLENNKAKTAVITVNPGTYYNPNWDITVSYED